MVTAGPPPPGLIPRRRPRLAWWALALVLLLVVAVVAAFIRLPYETIAPGTARAVNDRVSITGTATYPAAGRLLSTTVSVRDDVSPYEALWAWLDPNLDVVPLRQARGNLSPARYEQLNVAAMADSKQTAEVVALRHLGIDPVSGAGALLTEVLPGYPAADVLKTGDVVVGVDDRPVHLAEEMVAALRGRQAGNRVRLRIVRGTEVPRGVETTMRAGDGGRPMLGVRLATKDLKVVTPFAISIDSGPVVGPSAGLTYALAVLDLLTPGELTGGAPVAATGELDVTGKVMPIGGVHQKALAARAAGAKVFLVPRENYDEARAHPVGGLRFLPVGTFDEALDALGSLPGSNARSFVGAKAGP